MPRSMSSAAPPPGIRPFHVMAKPIGSRGNLECRYWFYLEKEPALYPGGALVPPDQLDKAVASEVAPPGSVGDFLIAVFERWVRRDGGRISVQSFDLAQSAWMGLGAAKAQLPRICCECPVRFACPGDCLKHRFLAAGPGEAGVSYHCPSYRRFFAHLDPAMRQMAALLRAGRPAADILSQAGGPARR